MTGRKEADPEGDAADTASLADADDSCPSCRQPLNDDGECETIGCPNSIDDGLDIADEFDDEDEDGWPPLPEGMLGEGDKDA